MIKHPIFKFQKKSHAEMMLDNKIFLSNMDHFRDAAKTSGLIHDEYEGSTIIVQGENEILFQVRNRLIYCSTSHFLSDSLFWAQSEGKECCIMITDPDEFYRRVSAAKDIRLQREYSGPCEYVERIEEVIQRYEKIMPDRLAKKICRQKHIKFKDQKETRGIWIPPEPISKTCIGQTLTVEVSDLLVWMDFSSFDEEKFRQGAQILITTHLKSGESSSFTASYPREILSPVIYNDPEPMLGYLVASNRIDGGFASGCEGSGFMRLGDRSVVCPNILANIERIEFSQIP
ncbi:hypothetical protein OIU19_03375 [Pseudomonas sp. BT-42-2]|uniref:hypothetical protein n=1 Tax=Pseudomonas sp. BT-42-2 TaxID=2986927 RepID=UPI0021F7022E|nr:hypothetical protein [Pseudomonas sp. BT-42-2]MCV9917823.1 hypothetical protein [Pseudomonas sp. BT-42-2]